MNRIQAWPRILLAASLLGAALLPGLQEPPAVHAAASPAVLIAKADRWSYSDEGKDYGAAMKSASYDYSGWKSGQAPLGYKTDSSGNATNNVAPSSEFGKVSTVIAYGPGTSQKNTASYFSKSIAIADPSAYESFQGLFGVDDGLVLYANGQEVYRASMPSGTVSYSTLATTSKDLPVVMQADLTAALRAALKPGVNIIAAEVHNQSPSSSDLYWDMQLLAVPTGSGTPGGGAEAPASLAMTFSGDPASSRAFAWYTPSAVTGTRLEIVEGTYTDATWPSAAATSIAGTSQSIQAYASSSDKSAGKKTSYVSHKATATGLKPGTTYSYRAGDGTSGRWSAVGTFRTAESSPSSYSFLFTTDPQGTTESEFVTWNHTLTEGMAKFPDARFVAVTGDLVDNGDLESQWGWVLGKPAELLRRLPLAPAVGNHESKSYSNFGWHFNLPDTGTGAQPAGSVYSFDYGPAHFMVLNTEFDEASGSDPIYQKQVAWLRADAAASSKKWKIVLLHKSPYSVANHSSSSDILFFRNNLTKVFDELGIDAVLGGHDHTYTRTYPMKANSPQTNPTLDANGDMVRPNGTLYVTSNAAGDKRYTPKSGPFPYAYKYGQPGKEMFTGVTVSTDRLTFQVYTTTEAGSTALYDRFGIVK